MSARLHTLAIAAFSVLGAAIATYLVVAHWTSATVACTTGGCETVQQSRYAEVGGVPVALGGAIAYLVVLASAWSARELVRVGAAAVALGATAFAAYLVYVQAAVLRAWCEWCLASDVVLVLLASLVLACALAPSEQ